MKAKSLQFGKAMSAALFVLLLSVVGMKNALAQTQVATLQHGDDIEVFYGMNAFVEAHTAAADGDIITLSGGTFTPPSSITKAIVLRGAGCYRDSIAGNYVTTISGTINLSIPNDSVSLTIEGVFFSGQVRYTNYALRHPYFIRCNFNNFRYNGFQSGGSGNMYNAQFVNCMISNCELSGSYNTFINCVIGSLTQNNSSSGSKVFYNSFVKLSNRQNNMSVYNCIISGSSNYVISDNGIAFNSIGIQLGTYDIFGSNPQFDCMTVTSYEEVFESFTGTFSFDEPYILKEDIANGFLGNDGTQVGIHGGLMPYNPRPTYMILNRCNVAGRSTIDGKLSVDIEVITEGE